MRGRRGWAGIALGVVSGACWGCDDLGADVPREGARRCNGDIAQAWTDGAWSALERCSYGCFGQGYCVSDPPTGPPLVPEPEPGEPAFFAVIIDDSQVFGQAGAMEAERCLVASGPIFAHGADIDAVGLFRGDELLGYLDTVDYREGGLCGSERANTMTDATQAKGAPDARVDSGFVSLGGGYLIGEFEPRTEFVAGDVVVVYEVGRLCGPDRRCDGRNEGYEGSWPRTSTVRTSGTGIRTQSAPSRSARG